MIEYAISAFRPPWLKYASRAVLEFEDDLVILRRGNTKSERPTFALAIDRGGRQFPSIVIADKPMSELRLVCDLWIRGHRAMRQMQAHGVSHPEFDGFPHFWFEWEPYHLIDLGGIVTPLGEEDLVDVLHTPSWIRLVMREKLSHRQRLVLDRLYLSGFDSGYRYQQAAWLVDHPGEDPL